MLPTKFVFWVWHLREKKKWAGGCLKYFSALKTSSCFLILSNCCSYYGHSSQLSFPKVTLMSQGSKIEIRV